MATETAILCTSALSIGVIHTLLGPDHYIPFVAMARSGCWSARKTLAVTVLCGLGHVAGSVAVGTAGLALGVMVLRLEALESWRGDLAAWLLIGFGLCYLAWGLRQAWGDEPNGHALLHAHRHAPAPTDAGGDDAAHAAEVWTPWMLFLVFVFGPCEPLIPLLMFPAAKANAPAVAVVVAAFALATVCTMTLMVMTMRYGLSLVHLPRLTRFSHACAGLTIVVCGLLVKCGL